MQRLDGAQLKGTVRQERMEPIALKITVLDWGIFYVFWVVTSLRTKQTAKRESIAGSIAHRVPAIFAFVLLVDAGRLGGLFSLKVLAGGNIISVLGLGLSLIGLAICIWARVTLGRNWSSIVMVKKDHELVQSGPYRFVRHPIYTGIITMFLANVLLSGRVGGILGLLCLVASFYVKLLREEKVMRAEFPSQYPEYCRRVKRLIPFIH